MPEQQEDEQCPPYQGEVASTAGQLEPCCMSASSEDPAPWSSLGTAGRGVSGGLRAYCCVQLKHIQIIK